MTRIETAIAQATARALADPRHIAHGRSGQIEVLVQLTPGQKRRPPTIVLDLEFLPLDVELDLLDALAANDPVHPFDPWS